MISLVHSTSPVTNYAKSPTAVRVSASKIVQCDLIIDFNYLCKFMIELCTRLIVFSPFWESAVTFYAKYFIKDRKLECVNYVKEKTFKHYRKMSLKNLLRPFDNSLTCIKTWCVYTSNEDIFIKSRWPLTIFRL